MDSKKVDMPAAWQFVRSVQAAWMANVVEATTLNESLRIEAFSLRELDGLDTFGLVTDRRIRRSVVMHGGTLKPNRTAR